MVSSSPLAAEDDLPTLLRVAEVEVERGPTALLRPRRSPESDRVALSDEALFVLDVPLYWCPASQSLLVIREPPPARIRHLVMYETRTAE